MRPTVTHRRDTVAMKHRTATVGDPCPTRIYAPTVTHRCDPGQLRACAGAHARAEKSCAQWEPSRRYATVTAFSAQKPSSSQLFARAPQANAEMALLGAMSFPALSPATARGNSGESIQGLLRPSGSVFGNATARHVRRGRTNTVGAYRPTPPPPRWARAAFLHVWGPTLSTFPRNEPQGGPGS